VTASPRPRAVCPPEHAHAATTTCYITHRCGCADCRRGIAARERRRYRRIGYGVHEKRVRVEPVRERVRELIDAGVPRKAIERGTGVSLHTVLYAPKPQKWIAADKARRVLEYLPDVKDLDPVSTISAKGTRRRVQALVAIGWPLAELGRRCGVTGQHLSVLARASRTRVETAEQITDLYEQLSMTLPPASTPMERRVRDGALAMAAREGWVPPLAWEDIDNDDQPATSDDAPARTKEKTP